jgi:hypothetical protein
MTGLTLRWHAEEAAVGLLASKVTGLPHATLPESAPIQGKLSTSAGRTVIFPHSHVETAGSDVPVQGPFQALEFSLTGILTSLLNPLPDVKISIFSLSTFDTAWILVPAASTGLATRALTAAGHTVLDTDSGTSRTSASADEGHPGVGETSGVPQSTEEP